MKYCLPLLLVATTVAPAQVFINGMAARAVIGQKTFTATDVPAPANLPDQYQPGIGQWMLGAASSVAYANGMLFVADSNNMGATPNNNRVLIYYDVKKVVPPANASLPAPTGSDPLLCPVCTGVYGYTYGQVGTVLGQADYDAADFGRSQTAMRTPTSVASDGKVLAVADTQNNRVLIWLTIPAPGRNNTPADVVVGNSDFTSIRQGVLDNKSLLGPQGVWIQNGRLFVADTRNHRVMVWNSIPTKNDTPADFVLGQKDFNTTSEQFVGQASVPPAANRLKNPVSVTSDGKRLYVADLGYNRVLIWNTIPTKTETPADVVLGQPDMVTEGYTSNEKMCTASGIDPVRNVTVYPSLCEATVNFPRYVMSDGARLFVADGGNDRVLIWNSIPAKNGAPADTVLGQLDMISDQVTDTSGFFTPNLVQGAPNSTRTPTGLAWDGTNLYVATPFDRRVLVFTPGIGTVAPGGVNNAASLHVFAVGLMQFGGTIQDGDTIQIVINRGADSSTANTYNFTVQASDTLQAVIDLVRNTINGKPDQYVLVQPGPPGANSLLILSREPGANGNNITVTTTLSNRDATKSATISVAGGTPTGGGNADTVAPGSLIQIEGDYLSDQIAGTTPDTYIGAGSGPNGLPTDLGGVQVYVDGNRLPLYYVSKTRIIAQLPFKLTNTNASSLYVRTVRSDGTVYVSTAVNLPIALQNPGIFATGTQEPRTALAYHGSSFASSVVLIDGITALGDTVTVKIDDRVYTYTAVKNDTNVEVRDNLIQLINANPEERLVAVPAGSFTRIRLFAKVAGPAGEGIKLSVSAVTSSTSPTGNTGPGVTMNVTSSQLCCSNVEDAPVTPANPAMAGETIKIYAAGVGAVKDLTGVQLAVQEGVPYNGPALNQPLGFLSSLAGGFTANVLYGGLKPGFIGIYEIHLQLSSTLKANPQTQLTIAQYLYTSNIVTIPVIPLANRPPN